MLERLTNSVRLYQPMSVLGDFFFFLFFFRANNTVIFGEFFFFFALALRSAGRGDWMDI